MPTTLELSQKDRFGADVAPFDAENPNRRDPLKFKNGDVRLDDAIKHNGGHLVMANIPRLFDPSW